MEIIKSDRTEQATFFWMNCEGSTAVTRCVVTFDWETTTARVFATYTSGVKWGYTAPCSVVFPLMDESSVGRFVNAVKKVATFAMRHETIVA